MAELIVEELRYGTPTVSGSFGPVAFHVESGACLGVSGPSGCGKTRLLRALADLDPSDGRVRLGDRDRGDTEPSEWRRQVAFLTAEPRWWLPTVGAHFTQGARSAEEAIEMLGLDAEVLTHPIDRLSSGEGQRLAVARLLDRTPAALLLDEPTAHLDVESAGRVESAIRRYRERVGAPVVWISHDAEQLRRVADQTLVLGPGGRVAAAS